MKKMFIFCLSIVILFSGVHAKMNSNLPREVIVTTDKMVYQNGEKVSIKVFNNTSKKIFYFYPVESMSLFLRKKIGTQTTNDYKIKDNKYSESTIKELLTGEKIFSEWDLKLRYFEELPKIIDESTGTYRIGFRCNYSNPLKDEKAMGDVSYSKEFYVGPFEGLSNMIENMKKTYFCPYCLEKLKRVKVEYGKPQARYLEQHKNEVICGGCEYGLNSPDFGYICTKCGREWIGYPK